MYILDTTAAIFICAFPLSQSNLADTFDMWFFAKKILPCFIWSISYF